jgi:hypothetical protein
VKALRASVGSGGNRRLGSAALAAMADDGELGELEGPHTRRGQAGLDFIGGRPLLRDVPARQGADRGSSTVRCRGQLRHRPACARTGA